MTEQPRMPTVFVESAQFSDKTTLSFSPTDVVVLVGPNNSGKSAALRELESGVAAPGPGIVLPDIQIRRVGTIEDVLEALESNSTKSYNGAGFTYSGFHYSVDARFLPSWWTVQLGPLADYFRLALRTERRIDGANPPANAAITSSPPEHPIHRLQRDDRIEGRVSKYFRQAFGADLVVHRNAGSVVPLLVGDRPKLKEGEDRVSATYVERLEAQTAPLEKQGDGMRAFATVLLALVTFEHFSIYLLDEPEAFLHPPQARLLGEFIAKERPNKSQVFVATHSTDILSGLLSARTENLRIVRVSREGKTNIIRELSPQAAKAISMDPLLRHSSVLQGIFHKVVLICESDSDCLFYQAISDLPSIGISRPKDALFVHSGGKDRIHKMVSALRALGVPTVVIADIDLLRDRTPFQSTVEALGGTWTDLSSDWKVLQTGIGKSRRFAESKDVVQQIRSVLDAVPKIGAFDQPSREQIEKILRGSTPWDAIKVGGESMIPAGDARQAYDRILRKLQAIGLWLVPVGELEGFCKSVAGHGPAWVASVLADHDLETSEELDGAKAFIKKIWQTLPA